MCGVPAPVHQSQGFDYGIPVPAQYDYDDDADLALYIAPFAGPEGPPPRLSILGQPDIPLPEVNEMSDVVVTLPQRLLVAWIRLVYVQRCDADPTTCD